MKYALYALAFAFGSLVWAAVNALFAWGTQYVLAAFGVQVGFWACFVAWFLFGALVRVIRYVGKSP